MASLFQNLVYAPILNLLGFLYGSVAFGDLGVAIILLTIVIRVVLFPVFYKGAKDQAIIQKIQPRVKEIQGNQNAGKEEQAKALMDLYKEHKVNPFSSILLLLVQLPVFIALFKIFGHEALLFPTRTFIGLIDLGAKSVLLALIAGALQYFQLKMALPKQNSNDPAAAIGKAAVFFGPGLTLIVLFNLPSALGLYWVVSNAFSLVQQVYINKRVKVQ